jgi:hypothetical protein
METDHLTPLDPLYPLHPLDAALRVSSMVPKFSVTNLNPTVITAPALGIHPRVPQVVLSPPRDAHGSAHRSGRFASTMPPGRNGGSFFLPLR